MKQISLFIAAAVFALTTAGVAFANDAMSAASGASGKAMEEQKDQNKGTKMEEKKTDAMKMDGMKMEEKKDGMGAKMDEKPGMKMEEKK